MRESSSVLRRISLRTEELGRSAGVIIGGCREFLDTRKGTGEASHSVFGASAAGNQSKSWMRSKSGGSRGKSAEGDSSFTDINKGAGGRDNSGNGCISLMRTKS